MKNGEEAKQHPSDDLCLENYYGGYAGYGGYGNLGGLNGNFEGLNGNFGGSMREFGSYGGYKKGIYDSPRVK